MEKNIVYPGSFDPITIGHYDLIVRASRIFDKVTILVLKNRHKENLFTNAEKIFLIKKALIDLPNVEVVETDQMMTT